MTSLITKKVAKTAANKIRKRRKIRKKRSGIARGNTRGNKMRLWKKRAITLTYGKRRKKKRIEHKSENPQRNSLSQVAKIRPAMKKKDTRKLLSSSSWSSS